MQIHNPHIDFVVVPAEVHLQSVLNRVLGFGGEAKSEIIFREWVFKQLQ